MSVSPSRLMAIIRFWNSPHRNQKWILLFCLFQFWVDSYRAFDLPSHDDFPRHFMNNNNNNEKWLFREKAKKRHKSNNQRENIQGSRVLTAGKSQRLMEKIFKLGQNKDEHLSYSFEYLPKKIYPGTAKPTGENSTQPDYRLKTSVQLQEIFRRKADLVFRDVVGNERLNSYAVVSTTEDNRGPSWYITIVSGVVVLLVVVALCVHAPCGCLWRRHRNEHDVSCPIASSNKGMCGKCFLHNSTTTKTMTYRERPHHVSVTMASNDTYHRPSSGDYSSQYTWAYNTHRPGKLSQAKSKVTNLIKGCQGSSHLDEPAAGYRYRPLKNTDKRNSLQTMYDPEWTSVGAFLNKNRPSSSYLGYGSTKESERKFVDRYCRRSRDSLDAEGEIVEYALKLRPRRRQVIELQEFPLGYSKSFLNIDLESDPGVVFDPYRDQLQAKRRGRKFERLTFSDSDLRQLSCTDKLGNYGNTNDLFGASKPRKSSLKMGTAKGKTNAKVVHFFPSNFSYDAQFVQVPPENKMTEENVGKFLESGKTSFIAIAAEASHLSRSQPTLNFDDDEISRGTTKYGNKKTDSKEHAVDCDLKSPSTETKEVRPNQRASSYVNYGCRSSTEVLSGSKEDVAASHGQQSHNVKIASEKIATKCFEPISSSFADLSKSDISYDVEPLASLLSPIRRGTRQKGGASIEKNKAAMTAGELACDTLYIQQALTTSKLPVPILDRSSPNAKSLYQPHPDDTTRWKSSQSHSQPEKDTWSINKTAYYEQYVPEKEEKTAT